MIFAAGFGTRMGSLTAERPKPLVPLAGEPMINHALGWGREARSAPIVANAHHHAKQLARWAAKAGVMISHEAAQILDTGGGLAAARPLLGASPAYTLNCDAIFAGPSPLSCLEDVWDPARMDALLLLVDPAHALGHALSSGFARAPDGRLTRAPELAYTGAQIMATDALASRAGQAFSLNEVWDAALAQGRLYGCLYPGRWCDAGHPRGLALAEELLRS